MALWDAVCSVRNATDSKKTFEIHAKAWSLQLYKGLAVSIS